MEFSPSRKEATDFNGGARYRNHIDSPSAEDFNNVIEGLLKVQDDIEQSSMAIEFVGGVTDNLSNTNQYLLKNVSKISDGLSVVEKRVDNLYARTFPEIDVIDNAVAYSKVVPEGALPYAEVAKVGGMSYKSDNLWKFGDIVSSGYNAEISNVFENLKPNTPYAVSWDYTSNGTADVQNMIIVYAEAGGFSIANGASFTMTEEQINTFTIAYGYFGSNATSGSMTKIMLNEGTTAKPYSPYFEGLRHAKVTAVKSIGANLLNIPDVEKIVNGVSVRIKNGVITVIGTATASGGRTDMLSPSFKLPAGTYTFLTTIDNPNLLAFLSDSTHSALLPATVSGNSAALENDTEVYFGLNFVEGAHYDESFSVMLNIGSTALPCSPYMESSLPIPTAVQSLPDYGLGKNATVNNHVDWSERKYHHPCVGGVLDGSENWSIDSSGSRFYIYSYIYDKSQGEIPSNKYHCEIWDALYVYVASTGVATVEEFKAALATDPLYIVYERATPEVTDISHLITKDNFIPVEAGGQIVVENEHGLSAPTTINYQVN